MIQLDDTAFFDDTVEFNYLVETLSQYRDRRFGPYPKSPIVSSPFDKYHLFARLLYSQDKDDFSRLKSIHENLHRFSRSYFDPLGISDTFSDAIYFEWMQGFNPSRDRVQREHFAHVSKVAYCCWKLLQILEMIDAQDGGSVRTRLVRRIEEGFKEFCSRYGYVPAPDLNYDFLLEEIVLLAAYMHDKGTAFNFYDDLRSKLLASFSPLWNHSLLIYGGHRGRARNKYSLLCQKSKECNVTCRANDPCNRRGLTSRWDPTGLRKLKKFLDKERVFRQKYWFNLLCTYVANRLPKTIYDMNLDDGAKPCHGFYSALELLSIEISCLGRKKNGVRDGIEREYIFATAAQAILLHDLKDAIDEVSIDETPAAYILGLADELQQWGRQRLDIDKLLQENILSWNPGEISQIRMKVDGPITRQMLDIYVPKNKIAHGKVKDVTSNIRDANEMMQERFNNELFEVNYYVA